MPVSKKFSTLILYKGSWSDTDITSFQQNQPGLITVPCSITGEECCMIQLPDTASTEHTSPPSLWQRWLIAASRLKLSLEISSVCTTTLPFFLHPPPSKPSLCLLPSLPHTPTASFYIWRSLQDDWMQHVVSQCSITESSSHETKGNLAKFGKFLF